MADSNYIDHINSISSLDFPASEDQINLFLEANKDYKLKTDLTRINGKKILQELRAEQYKPTNVDYHKRTVLAAEIVYQLQNEWSLGHVKLQKLIFLCQNSIDMALHTNFLKQAMGPYDPVLMRSIDKQLNDRKWFTFNRAAKQKYQPLEKVGGHKEWYEIYFSEQLNDIDQLIQTFRKMKTHKVELIGTLFASWLEVLELNGVFEENLLIDHFYKWSKEKEKFNIDEVKNAISWMLEKRIYPVI